MTNQLVLLYLLIVIPFTCSAQEPAVQSALENALQHTEQNSLYRNQVDWNEMKTRMRQMSTEADSIPDLKPAFDFMLESLNDTHGRVFYKGGFLSFYSGELLEHLDGIDWDIYNEIQSGQVYDFKTELIEKEIGYVRIVGLPMGDNQKMSDEIQHAVCQLIANGAQKWIIDLRYNGGGNMYPMVEGLTTIIGNGVVGGTHGLTEEENSVWKIENGDFYYDDFSVQLEEECSLDHQPKIAVLLSNYTASSGEAVAVIVKNRPHTRFFGEKSNGKVTVTDWHQINDETFMSISVSYYKDRTGIIYDKYVDVDEEVDFNPKADLKEDEGLVRAIEWLNDQD